DVSRSQEFGTTDQLKRELVTELCATLAFSAIRNNDKVGLICFTDRVEKLVPPRKGTTHVLRVIRELLAFEPEGRGTSIRAAMDHLNRISRRRAVTFLVSDFQDAGYEPTLGIARRRHDLILVDVADRRELALPACGLLELVDAETGERLVVDAGSARFRRAFESIVRRERETRAAERRRRRLDVIEVRTGESFVDPLNRFFRARGVRQGR
ncbi:MAG: DUF58 domain-containing protein, partial [Planctomycetota bacterium]